MPSACAAGRSAGSKRWAFASAWSLPPDINGRFTFQRLNKEIKRRTAVVGIFPNRASAIRLVGMILAEQDDEWQDGRHYFRPETLALIDAEPEIQEVPTLLVAS